MKNVTSEEIVAEISANLEQADAYWMEKYANLILARKVKFDIVSGFTQEERDGELETFAALKFSPT